MWCWSLGDSRVVCARPPPSNATARLGLGGRWQDTVSVSVSASATKRPWMLMPSDGLSTRQEGRQPRRFTGDAMFESEL